MIFVSPETGSKDLGPLLRKRGLEVHDTTPLLYADVEFVGRGVGSTPVQIGVEVKRLTELTTDWDRFAGEQIPKMLACYDHRWVVYEGEWIRDARGRLCKKLFSISAPLHGDNNASSLRKKLITLEMNGGFHRQNTRNRVDTVDFLVDLYRWWTDEDEDKHKSHIVVYEPKGITPMSIYQRAFAAWPHLSRVRCKAVARRFHNSIKEACMATVEDWTELEVPSDDGKTSRRLGTSVAEDIVKFLRGEGSRR